MAATLAWEEATIAFVTPPSKDFECTICLSVVREPFLTTCCGSHFCKGCVGKVKKSSNQFPACREKPINAVIDKYFQRQLNQLQVYCPRRSVQDSRFRCEWVGELGSVEEHLAIDQLEGECQYVEVKCHLCGQPYLRKLLNKHIKNSCPNRSTSCQYCDFQSTYEDVTKRHMQICPNYPVVCPNSCSSTVFKRYELQDHLASCLEQDITCTFSEMGCKEKMQRKFLQHHLESNIVQHQMLTCQAFYVQQQQLRETKQELLEIKSRAGQTEYWIDGFQMMAEEVKKNNWPLYLTVMNRLVTSMSQPVAPIIVSLPNILVSRAHYSEHSLPFYTHPRGYKMCLSLHMPSCHHAYNGSRRSITVHFCIVEGEFDDSVVWPFESIVTVTLLNNHKDESHEERVYGFTANRYSHDQAIKITNHGQTGAYWKKRGKMMFDKRLCLDYNQQVMANQQASVGHDNCSPVESTEYVTFNYNSHNQYLIKETFLYFKVSF